jgi:hypothetical protein
LPWSGAQDIFTLTCLGTKGIGVGTLALVSVGTGDLEAGCQISSSLPLYFLGLSCFSILNLLFEYILTRGVDPGEEVRLVVGEVNDLDGLEATVVQTKPSSDDECSTFTTGKLLTAANSDGVSASPVDSCSSSGDTITRALKGAIESPMSLAGSASRATSTELMGSDITSSSRARPWSEGEDNPPSLPAMCSEESEADRDEIGEPITAGASTVVCPTGVPAREAESEGATEIVTARAQERVTTMV